jgi:hypothetical protein
MQHPNFISSATKTQKAFPFLQLPAEIRNIIYSYYVIQGKMLVTPENAIYARNHMLPRQNELALLYVCRKIHQESASFLFARNVLHLGDHPMHPSSKAWPMLYNRTSAGLQSTKSIYFLYGVHPKRPMDDLQFLDRFPELRTLQVRHTWHDSLVNITADALEVISEDWGQGWVEGNWWFKPRRQNSLQFLVDRLQAWKPTAKISVRMVKKHGDKPRW